MFRRWVDSFWAFPSSALVSGAFDGDLEQVKRWIEYYKDQPSSLNTECDTSRYKMTALHMAAMNGNVQIADALLLAGADANVKDERGETPLITACRYRRADVAIRLILSPGIDIYCVDDQGYTAIMLSAKYSLIGVFDYLATMSSSVLARFQLAINYQPFPSRDTLLHCAVVGGDANFVAKLLTFPELDLGLVNQYGLTAAQEARRLGCTAIAVMIEEEIQRRSRISDVVAEDVDEDVVEDIDMDMDEPVLDIIPNSMRDRLCSINYEGVIPIGFLCPISREIMCDPVTVCSGQTYDRSSLQIWFSRNPGCSELADPINPEYKIKKSELNNGTNIVLKDAIELFVSKREKAPLRKSPRLKTSAAAAAAAASVISDEERNEQMRRARIRMFDKSRDDEQPAASLASSPSLGR